ncbi:hypothetical protein M422DRAFT_51828 [Sphaerobolus stellatus SS14]|uniref:Uncharacterized protein n=1 Tax=Sphaerobolus stellatus (strain SS14) TaxID=990650 RepID=A0A0C9VBN0_SPHS4|nr:hypothetical protein M422DRAFT_51828 [Sphaerobolus stellatus SS14]
MSHRLLISPSLEVPVTGNTLILGMYMFKAVMEGCPLPRVLHPAAVELFWKWFAEVNYMNSQQYPHIELLDVGLSTDVTVNVDLMAQEISRAIIDSSRLIQHSEENADRHISHSVLDESTPKFISIGEMRLNQVFSDTLKDLLDLRLEGSRIANSLVTPQEVLHFKEGKSVGPTIDKFTMDWTGEMTKGWNLRAAHVFSKHFLDTVVPSYPPNTFPEEFMHTDVLIIKFQRLAPRILKKNAEQLGGQNQDRMDVDMDVGANHTEVRKQQKRRRDRKHKLYRSRCEKLMANMECPNLLWNVVNELGPDGMSSDESEGEGIGGRTTHLRRKRLMWRNEDLDPILAYADGLSKEGPYGAFASTTRGSSELVRLRESRKNSQSKVKKGLPLNLYSSSWLKNSQAIRLLAARSPLMLPVAPGRN